ncbi:MAG: hypothetical protein ACSHWZ_10245 [Sulfitobacter sp.]
MEFMLSKEVQSGLDQARMDAMKKSSRLRIDHGGTLHRVLRLWKTGFAMEAETAPHLRGLVDIYDGAKHLFQCLIIAAEEENGEMLFEFKRATPVSETAPLDFEKDQNAPVALIANEGDLIG